MRSIFRTILFSGLIIALAAGCVKAAPAAPTASAPAPTRTEAAPPTDTPAPPSATPTPVPPSATPTLTSTVTETPTPSDTPLPTDTPTATQPPPTPSGKDAIYIYLIQTGTGGPVACGDSLVPVNTGLARSGDVEADVRAALGRLFVKIEKFGSLYNPAFRSNIDVTGVEFKAYSGLVNVDLNGTYVRSGDRCDDSRVRAQVWTTIRQFEGVKTVYILLNGNLLGDILATGK